MGYKKEASAAKQNGSISSIAGHGDHNGNEC